jgi:hypothetical protein
MKGYLQGLVRTVTNPAESVHPWAGSIFAAVHRGNSNVVETEESAAAAPVRQSSEVMSPTSAQHSQFSIRAQSSPPDTGHNAQTSESQTTYIAPGFPQAEKSASHGPSVSERLIFEPLIRDIEGPSPDSVDTTKSEMTPAEESETALPQRNRRPFDGAEAIIKPRTIGRRMVAPSPAPQTKTPNAPAIGSHVAGDRRTDDIQIHIGRIEVTAIHPPAPSISKVRNKEISLNAYLKRRNGGAR